MVHWGKAQLSLVLGLCSQVNDIRFDYKSIYCSPAYFQKLALKLTTVNLGKSFSLCSFHFHICKTRE